MISIIIPALNEVLALPATLDAILAQPVDSEVFVVDGGSTDRTPQIVEETSARDRRLQLLRTAPGRALQMNAGAEAARGDWLPIKVDKDSGGLALEIRIDSHPSLPQAMAGTYVRRSETLD